MMYERYLREAKKMYQSRDGQHVVDFAKKVATEFDKVVAEEITIEQFAENVPDSEYTEDAPIRHLNYIKSQLIEYYPE